MRIHMKKLFFLLFIIAAVIAGKFYWDSRQSTITAEAKAPQYETVVVERGAIVIKVSATGRVVSNLDVDIKCKASGEIRRLPFDVSDSVKKGDLLVELNPVDEKRNVRQAEISLSASQAKLAQAKQHLLVAQSEIVMLKKRAETALTSTRTKLSQATQNLLLSQSELMMLKKKAENALVSARANARDAKTKATRLKDLLGQSLASQEEFDTAENTAIKAEVDLKTAEIKLEELKTNEMALKLKEKDIQLAETELENAEIKQEELKTNEMALKVKEEDIRLAEVAVEHDRINLSNAQQRLNDTRVIAPMDGVVSLSNVQVGQIISSAISNVGGGTTVLTLSDLSSLFVLASVDESDIGRVKKGQIVSITVDAFPQKRFIGEVVRISTKGVNTSNVITFEVKIEVQGEDKSLLKPEMTANVEIVADQREDALLLPIEAVLRRKRERIVVVPKNDTTNVERVVRVGISDGLKMEIIDGLAEGQKVILREADADSKWRKNDSSDKSMERMIRRAARSRKK